MEESAEPCAGKSSNGDCDRIPAWSQIKSASSKDAQETNGESDYSDHSHATHDTMGKFDDRLNLRTVWNHFAIAERPVASASGAGAAGAHECAPQNNQKIGGQHSPRESREVGATGRCGGGNRGQDTMYLTLNYPGQRDKKTEPAPAISPPAAAAVPSVTPPAEKPDRFAGCPFKPEDFRIGATQYTPDKYLQVGFEGSTARAVSMLKDRLNEARQIAANVAGSALTEVQRQSRVLDYFNCRLKIEQTSDK